MSSTSVFDIFKIGIGPSSSHTVGPMKAARQFAEALRAAGVLERTAAVHATLFGSLGATGRGHGTDRAIVLGLLGELPEAVDPDAIPGLLARVRETGRLALLGEREIGFREAEHLAFERRTLPFHPNGLRFAALDAAGRALTTRVYYSIGGGFVVEEPSARPAAPDAPAEPPARYPFRTARELLARCAEASLPISGVMLENERAHRPEAEIRAGLLGIWDVMQACVARGCKASGALPGALHGPRRAPTLFRKLTERPEAALADPLPAIDFVNLYALAVNEENAAGA